MSEGPQRHGDEFQAPPVDISTLPPDPAPSAADPAALDPTPPGDLAAVDDPTWADDLAAGEEPAAEEYLAMSDGATAGELAAAGDPAVSDEAIPAGLTALGGASWTEPAPAGVVAGDGGEDLAGPDRLRAAVEAVLLVVDVPASAMMLAQVLDRPVAEVEDALGSLRAEYDSGGRGLDLREVAEGWRLYSREDFAAYVRRFVLDGQQARLTQAALETLAVIAYRQPVTRSRISGIRGVSVDAVMRTLLTRGLVEECGADPDTGGGLYRTTRLFLEKLGLRSLEELPSLAPLLPDTSQLDDVELST